MNYLFTGVPDTPRKRILKVLEMLDKSRPPSGLISAVADTYPYVKGELIKAVKTDTQAKVCNQDGFPIEAVKHLSRCACNCQTCRADVTHNRHMASCMVGKAQEYLEEDVIEKALYGGLITHD